MSTDSPILGATEGEGPKRKTAVPAALPRPAPQANPVHNVQFSLRSMLIAVAVIAGLLAILAVVNTLTSVLLIWFVLLVFCHVAANAWGSKSGRRQMSVEVEGPPRGALRRDGTGTPGPHAKLHGTVSSLSQTDISASHLGHRRALRWWLFLPIPAGAALGAYAGVVFLFGSFANVPNLKTLAVAGVSSAALGGFGAFLVSSFLGVAIAAVFDAGRHAARH